MGKIDGSVRSDEPGDGIYKRASARPTGANCRMLQTAPVTSTEAEFEGTGVPPYRKSEITVSAISNPSVVSETKFD